MLLEKIETTSLWLKTVADRKEEHFEKGNFLLASIS